ncbi:nuclear transport factor 2 family protein [Flavihumibacter fluvii]|uniref:nuclear transport factor 2 family protein n=1 Tax=Flavihumibacter fluvii TaxID=2838157 RepID=UPI001BDF395B|nr:nuclear transport factor 2 family protein [Flavihumibacter fluvii]ULQ50763.1 nuclear transport factor 2 family protein [Flavihumibacter fluvii]
MNTPGKIFIVMLLLNCGVACSQSNLKPQKIMELDKTENDTSQVLAVTRQLTELMIEKNTVAMSKILDKEFTLTHITGYVQPKEEWFSEIESERMKYYSYKEVKTSININGDKATFIGQNILDARIWGTRNNWRLQQTMQLEKRNGKWIILKSVASLF